MITTIGAKLDKKVALETVVNLMDQCQQIKSSAKNNPEIKINKKWFLKTLKLIFSISLVEEKKRKKGKLKNIL